MGAHVPGPWRFVNGNLPRVVVGQGCVASVHKIGSFSGRHKPETITANGYLLAAAPELYDELLHLVRLMEPLEDRGQLDIPGLATLNGARAALAKARGEQ